jgi:hypothetical protein
LLDYKVNIAKRNHFPTYTGNEKVKFEFKNINTIYISMPQDEILKYKPNKICMRSK